MKLFASLNFTACTFFSHNEVDEYCDKPFSTTHEVQPNCCEKFIEYSFSVI